MTMMKPFTALTIASLVLLLSGSHGSLSRKLRQGRADSQDEWDRVTDADSKAEEANDGSLTQSIGMNPMTGDSQDIGVKQDVMGDYLVNVGGAATKRTLNVFEHIDHSVSIQPTWRDQVHAVWVNGPTTTKQLGSNWPAFGTVVGKGTGQCNATLETFTGYNANGAYCQKTNDNFNQNPYLAMYSGKVGLVLDASPETSSTVIRQLGGTGHLDSSLINPKGVYDNVSSGGLELQLDVTCTGSGPISARATLDGGVAEFGMVRQGHAVTQVTVDGLVWSDASNKRIVWNTDPTAMCTLLSTSEDPANPNCNVGYSDGVATNSCKNPQYPDCVNFIQGVRWGDCISKPYPRNPDNATCSGNYDNGATVTACQNPTYPLCQAKRCYVDFEHDCWLPQAWLDITMWGDSIALHAHWGAISACAGTVTVEAQLASGTITKTADLSDKVLPLLLTGQDGSADLVDAEGTSAGLLDLTVSSGSGGTILKRNSFGDFIVEVPTSTPKCPYTDCGNIFATVKVVATNANALDARTLRLSLSRDFQTMNETFRSFQSGIGSEITGMSIMVWDTATGQPSGIPVHISKNWHSGYGDSVYAGRWWTANVLVHLPAASSLDLTFAISYERYKGISAYSHAQLSIVGYSNKWLWEESALGTGGENFCMDPYGSHTRAFITDVRPKLFDGQWKENVGGGDFLLYFDQVGSMRYKKELDAVLLSNGPCLSNATYTSITDDGAIQSTVQISGGRTDDLVRIFMHIRHEAVQATDFSRLAFFQMGSETYNYNAVFQRFVFGSGATETHNFAPPCQAGTSKTAAKMYNSTGIFRTNITGSGPWWFAMGPNTHSVKYTTSTKVVGDRGLVVRSYDARFGGQGVNHPSVSVLCDKIELGPPRGITALLQGDYVDMTLEFLVLPRPQDFPVALANSPTSKSLKTLSPLLSTSLRVKEHAIRDIRVTSFGGGVDRVESHYPIRVCAANGFDLSANSLMFTVTGQALGYVPIVLCNLASSVVPAGYGLWKRSQSESAFTFLTNETDSRQANFFDRANQAYELVFNAEIVLGGSETTTDFYFGSSPV